MTTDASLANPIDFESEAYDRAHMKLPGAADELVAAVLAANPSTVGP